MASSDELMAEFLRAGRAARDARAAGRTLIAEYATVRRDIAGRELLNALFAEAEQKDRAR